MLKLPAYFSGFSSRADKSIGLKFTTQELSPETLSDLQSLNQSFGWLAYSENQIIPQELPSERVEAWGKSPAERLHDVLYVYFKQQKKAGTFEDFYKGYIEKRIEEIKAKLL